MDIDGIKHEALYIVDQAFLLDEQFCINQARRIYKQAQNLQSIVLKLITRLHTTKELTVNIDLQYYEDTLNYINSFLTHLLRYNIKTNTGFRMFIKDIVSYNFTIV